MSTGHRVDAIKHWFSAVYTRPSRWPLWLRRAYVLTLPVSCPLWALSVALSFILWCLGYMVTFAGFVVIVAPIMLCVWGFLSLREAMSDLWRAPSSSSEKT